MAVNTVHYFYLSGNWTSAKWVSLQEALSGNKAQVQLVWGNWGVWYPMRKPYIYHWRAHKNSQIRGSIWKFVIYMQPFHNGTLVLIYFLEFCSFKFMQVSQLITTVHQSPLFHRLHFLLAGSHRIDIHQLFSFIWTLASVQHLWVFSSNLLMGPETALYVGRMILWGFRNQGNSLHCDKVVRFLNWVRDQTKGEVCSWAQ